MPEQLIKPAETDGYHDNGFDLVQLLLTSNSGGKSIDLKPLFRDLVIYETIFDDKMYGEIVISDSLNLSESMPILGNESILIEFKTKSVVDQPIRIVGKTIVPMGKARTGNEKLEVYKLQFISDMQFRSRMTKVTGSYSGRIATASNDSSGIANKIFSDYFGKANLSKLKVNETTAGNHKFIIPYWSPVFTMSWLAQRATTPKPSFYVFYEDVDGFHFKNIIKEVQKAEKLTYRVEPQNGSNLSDVLAFMTRIQDYSVTSYFDRLDEYSSGMYSGTLQTHDITTKKYSTYTSDYLNEIFPESKHLNTYPLFPEGTIMSNLYTESRNGFKNLMPVQQFSDDGVIANYDPETYYLNRKSFEKQFTTMRMTIKVPGNSNLRLLDVLNLQIPKSGYMDESDSNWQDRYLSGRYLIVSLKTEINKGGYKTTVELSKDSLIMGIPSRYEDSGSSPI